MADIFRAYDEEFNSLSREIAKNLGSLRSLGTPSSEEEAAANGSATLIRQLDALLLQAADLIKQMEVEVRSHDTATRKVLTDKVLHYKKSLTTHRTDFERAKEAAERVALGIGSKSQEQRQRLLDVNDKLAMQNEKILNATRTVAETEEVGIEIIQELGRNREKIQSAHGKVKEFSGLTDTARRMISSMQRRDVQQRFILCFIAIVLAIAIGVTVYFTQKSTTSSSSSSGNSNGGK